MTDEQIENTFTYHAPLEGQPGRYEKIRAKAKEMAHVLKECGTPSRELSLAFTALQQAVMWANASIAVNETVIKPVSARAVFGGELRIEDGRFTNAPGSLSVESSGGVVGYVGKGPDEKP